MIVYITESIPPSRSAAEVASYEAAKARVLATCMQLIARDDEEIRNAIPRFVPDALKPPLTWKVKQPGRWSCRRKTGEIIMNPYSVGELQVFSGTLEYFEVSEYFEHRFASSAGTVSVVLKRRRVNKRTQRLAISPTLPNPEVLKADARNAAFSSAHSGAVDIAVQLAELPETLFLVKTLRQTVDNLRKSDKLLKELERRLVDRRASSLRRGNEQQIRKAEAFIRKQLRASNARQMNPFRQGSVAALMVDIWMLWRFAIRPLILTTEAYVNDINAKRRRYASYRAPRTDRSVTRTSTTSGLLEILRITEIDHKVQGNVRVQGYKPFGAKIQTYTFNVPLAIWERIPYTWALDRFIHIGNVLSALHKPENLLASKGCVSTKTTVTDKLILVGHKTEQEQSVYLPYAPGGPFTWKGTAETRLLLPQGTKLEARGSGFTREIVNGPTYPVFNFQTWHLARAADLVGLATQLLRKK